MEVLGAVNNIGTENTALGQESPRMEKPVEAFGDAQGRYEAAEPEQEALLRVHEHQVVAERAALLILVGSAKGKCLKRSSRQLSATTSECIWSRLRSANTP